MEEDDLHILSVPANFGWGFAMKAVAVTPGIAHSLALREMPEPEPGDGEVLVQVLRVGVCGTDQEIVRGLYGKAPIGSDFLVIGHEGLGRVVAVGSQADGLAAGDYVAATVRRACPHTHCRPCRRGHNDMCRTGDFTERGIGGRHGFLSEYYVEDPRFLTPVPAALAPAGVLLEPLAVAEKALRQCLKIQERLPWALENAVVLGAGAIGLLAAMLLRLRGINTWVFDLSSPDGSKARIVGQIGARFANTGETPVSAIAETIGGVDLIVEATGYAPLIFDAYQQLGNNGVLCLLGVAGHTNLVSVDAGHFNNRLVLGNRLVFGSVNANAADFRQGVEHLAQVEERWPGATTGLLTRQVTIAGFQSAFERQPEDIKVTVELEEESANGHK